MALVVAAVTQAMGSLMAGLVARQKPGVMPQVTPYEFTTDQYRGPTADGVQTYRVRTVLQGGRSARLRDQQ